MRRPYDKSVSGTTGCHAIRHLPVFIRRLTVLQSGRLDAGFTGKRHGFAIWPWQNATECEE